MFVFFKKHESAEKTANGKNPAAKKRRGGQGGFFLAELVVAVFIFGIVMTISVGSLVTALDANKKAQSLKSVLNNLNVVLDTMTKSLAVGTYYYCGDLAVVLPHTQTSDCPNGDTKISFLFNEDLGRNDLADDVVTYKFFQTGDGHGYIARTQYLDGVSSAVGPIRMTAPEVDITNVRFFVTGSTPASRGAVDFEQPKVRIVIDGNVPIGARNQPTAFTVQTLVSQRIPDFE